MKSFIAFENRELLSEADARALQRQGILAMDPERALPRWFDGRYLTARDLTREQNYFLSRQTTIGKAIGRGVIDGLEVDVDPAATAERSRIVIGAGQGIAFDGAHLILPSDLAVNLADIAVQDTINAKLGLSANPGAPIRSRTGLFVLSLRAVEYTANAISAFPTTVTGQRTTQLGDRIEAVAVTLTPYAPVDVPFDSDDARAMASQRIFQGEEETGVPGYALPLAMLSLRNGAIEWIDLHLVRRELTASQRNLLGLGLSRDQLRLAHFHQYRAALADVVASYRDRGQPPRFNADQHFRVLPAAGPMPAAAVDPAAQTQLFFPGEVEVELSIIPADELPALIDDSFELPPIDLSRPVKERDSLSVMVLAPLPRHVLRSQIAQLGKLTRPLKPISMLGRGPQKPIEKLATVRISLADVAAARLALAEPATEAWAMLISSLASFGTAGDAGTPMLWYARRRTLAESVTLESALAAVGHPDTTEDGEIGDPDAPAEPAPGDGTGEPTEPPPDVLGPEARATLVRMSGLGDLAKIAQAQMIRVSDDVRTVYVTGLNNDFVAGSPLAMTALTARILALAPDDTAKAKTAVEAVAKANPLGMKLLGVGLLGETNVRVNEARFKQLTFFTTTKGLLEQAAEALPKLDATVSASLITKLAKAIDAGSDDGVVETVKAMAAAPATTLQPAGGTQPAAGTTAAAEASSAAAAEAAAAQARAKAFVETLSDDSQKKAMSQLLQNADPVARDTLVNRLAGIKIGRSRIATGAVLAKLQGGSALRLDQLGSITAVNGPFVDGLAKVEPLLLDAPRAGETTTPTPASRTSISSTALRTTAIASPATLAIRPALDTARVTSLIAGAARTVEQKRLQLLSTNSALPTLAAFGRQATAEKLKSGAQIIVAALDATNASAVTVKAAIVKAFKESGA